MHLPTVTKNDNLFYPWKVSLNGSLKAIFSLTLTLSSTRPISDWYLGQWKMTLEWWWSERTFTPQHSLNVARSSSVIQTPTPLTLLTTMAEPEWQELLRLRLLERNSKESSYAPIIEQCALLPMTFMPGVNTYLDRRLAQQTKVLKERNASLLRAVGSVKVSGVGTSNTGSGSGGECVNLSLVLLYASPTTL
jgi:hypothetical protein